MSSKLKAFLCHRILLAQKYHEILQYYFRAISSNYLLSIEEKTGERGELSNFTNNLTSSSTLHQIWRGFCERLSVSPRASSSHDWRSLLELQHCSISDFSEILLFFKIFSFSMLPTIIYQCHRSPWLVCLVSACSQSEEWIPPSPSMAHLVA